MNLFTVVPLVQAVERTLAPFSLGGIAFGVVAKYVYDYYVRYVKAKNKKNVTFDWKAFMLTLVLAVIISVVSYSFLFDKVRQLDEPMLVFSIAAQGGFFWQSVLGEMGKQFVSDAAA